MRGEREVHEQRESTRAEMPGQGEGRAWTEQAREGTQDRERTVECAIP